MRAALSVHAERGSLGALDAAAFEGPSTKQAFETLSGFGEGDGGRTLVALVEGEENAALSFRNLARVNVLQAGQVGVADVIGAARLVASPAALEQLTKAAVAPSRRGAGASEEEGS
jgi:large subunit ribosomal protein L4